ncbi:hypothetical protein SPI_02665 [Niveomyces insectorum RCEF 264]|uniref:DUF7702 domain-containing protein n=1 Tax=Niveomyces insectorum RCEF 264 TaxID=1081102 RepID=A0A162KC33_9HYPO|nr:hypothetical protein SPI_02665 [Niveomyces insectorum RCEF 264]
MPVSNSLAAAEVAIQSAYGLLVVYLFVRHLPAGILGWFFLFSFCMLRIVGGALSLGASPSSTSTSIVSNIGLSPLLLAAGGILHEARSYRLKSVNKRVEWVLGVTFHFLVATGIALLAVGVSGLASDHPQANDNQLLDVGLAMLAVSWALLGLSVVALFFERGNYAATYSSGTTTLPKLLMSVVFALPFIGIRLFYSIVALTTRKPYLSPVSGALTIRVLLSFLPEVITVLGFLVAGFKTRNAARTRK